MRLAILTSRIRVEEKLLIDALRQRAIAFDIVDDGELLFDLSNPDERWREYDAVLCRSLSQSRGLAVLNILEHWGIHVYNPAAVTALCNDKLLTTLALLRAGIPTPHTLLAFDSQVAIRGMEMLSYPVVLKPTTGSWGRLVARINDRDAAEAVLEHRETLGSYQQHIHYIQEHIANSLCVRTAQAVGGGILAIDVLEDAQRGLLVNEINATMEFRNSIAPTGVDIPSVMLDYVLSAMKEEAVR